MDYAKKMILIEPEQLEKFKKENINNVSTNILSRLDEEMNKVLNTKLEDREKWSLYLQTLQRYLYFAEKDRQPLEIPITSIFNDMANTKKEKISSERDSDVKGISSKVDEVSGTSENYGKSQLLHILPKSYKSKGELLIDFLLKNKEKIYWDEKGTVFIDNKEVNKSNILDLINDVIRPLRNSSPRGWTEFSVALKDLKVPLSYIGNPRRSTYISVMSNSPNPGDRFSVTSPHKDSLNTDVYTTPQSSGGTHMTRKKLDWKKWNPY